MMTILQNGNSEKRGKQRISGKLGLAQIGRDTDAAVEAVRGIGDNAGAILAMELLALDELAVLKLEIANLTREVRAKEKRVEELASSYKTQCLAKGAFVKQTDKYRLVFTDIPRSGYTVAPTRYVQIGVSALYGNGK